MPRLRLLILLSLAACATARVDRGPGPECDDILRRVVTGDTAGMRSREQPPRVRNRRYIERRMSDSMAVLDLDSVPFPVLLRYRITPTGRTEQIRVARSSGSAAFDSVGTWAMGFAEHEPARLDGCPVAVWVEAPLTARLPPRRRAEAEERRP